MQGDNDEILSCHLNFFDPRIELEDYVEKYFRGDIAWGVTAIARYMEQLAQERLQRLTKDLAFLPSLIKFGVGSKLACHFARLGLSRSSAIKISKICSIKSSVNEEQPEYLGQSTLFIAGAYLSWMTNQEIIEQHLNERELVIVQKARGHYLSQISTSENNDYYEVV